MPDGSKTVLEWALGVAVGGDLARDGDEEDGRNSWRGRGALPCTSAPGYSPEGELGWNCIAVFQFQ